MPKRSADEDSDEYIRRKMRKIEKKLRKRKKRVRSRRVSSDSSNSGNSSIIVTPVPSLPEGGQSPLLRDTVLSITDNSEQILTQTEVLVEPVLAQSSEPQEESLDEDILQLLGDTPSKIKRLGSKIQKELALRWEHIATSGLTKEVRKDLIDRHLIPENCQKLAAPLLNPEVKAALTDVMIGKDKAIELKQTQTTSVITCIGETLTNIFNCGFKDQAVIKPLLEGAQLLCDLQYTESMKRRSFICSYIKKDIKSRLYETEIDAYLFGEKLPETLKSAKAINKSGSEIRPPKPKIPATRAQSRNLNSRPQLANSRQPAKRQQDSPAYRQMPMQYIPASTAPQHRAPQYLPQHILAPPPPPPPPPPPQRSKQRPYQRR